MKGGECPEGLDVSPTGQMPHRLRLPNAMHAINYLFNFRAKSMLSPEVTERLKVCGYCGWMHIGIKMTVAGLCQIFDRLSG